MAPGEPRVPGSPGTRPGLTRPGERKVEGGTWSGATCVDPDRPMDPTNPITAERVGPGATPGWFWAVAGAMGLAAALAGVGLGADGRALVVEANTPWANLGLALDSLRILSALGAGLVVFGVTWVGRRFWHNPAVGILTGLLVALDPWLLQLAHTGTPASLSLAAVVAAWALAMGLRVWHHTLAGIALALAALLNPAVWPLGLALAAMTLLRGHVYAAPRHLAVSAGQLVALPILGAVLGHHWLGPACTLNPAAALVLAHVVNLGPVPLVPNPATWFGGLGALAFLAGAGFLVMIRQARVARLPGRIQIRLVDALDPHHGRALWLLLLMVVSPPAMWILFLPLALAAGVALLGQDAPGFGAAVALVLLVFAGLVIFRSWDSLLGVDVSAALDLVPWAKPLPC